MGEEILRTLTLQRRFAFLRDFAAGACLGPFNVGASLLDLVRGAGREKQQALSVDDESDDMAATLRSIRLKC